MRRLRRAPLAAVVPFAIALSLTACTGSGDATQGSVQDDVLEALRADASRDNPRLDVPEGDADDVAECVADTMFEGGFSPEERNEITRANDGDEADAELVTKVQELVDGCLEGGADAG